LTFEKPIKFVLDATLWVAFFGVIVILWVVVVCGEQK
jgi:hypothetical protein